MTTNRRHFCRQAAALAATWSGALPIVRAAAAPALKSLQLVVPTPPGSQPDLIARWLLDPLARRMDVAGQVLNRPGAAGALAADAVLAAAPETGTLLLGGLDHVAYSHLNSNRRALDPFVDFLPVAAVNRDSWLLVTSAEAGPRSVAELVERARGRGPLAYASTGEGSTAHLLTARLCQALGVQAQHVPYRDPWMPDLIAGRIHFVVAPTPAVLGAVRGGRVRALASLTDERLPLLGVVPTLRELGWADQVFHGGLFVFAPAALEAHAEPLNRALVAAQGEPEVLQRYQDAAIEPTPLTLPAVHEMVRQRLRLVDAMRLAVFGRTR